MNNFQSSFAAFSVFSSFGSSFSLSFALLLFYFLYFLVLHFVFFLWLAKRGRSKPQEEEPKEEPNHPKFLANHKRTSNINEKKIGNLKERHPESEKLWMIWFFLYTYRYKYKRFLEMQKISELENGKEAQCLLEKLVKDKDINNLPPETIKFLKKIIILN